MAALNGERPNREGREGRERLTARPFAVIENTLASITFDGFDIQESRRWGNALMRARENWADIHRHGRRYSDVETARANNSLVRKGRDGAR